MPDANRDEARNRDPGSLVLVVLRVAGWLLLLLAGGLLGLAKPETTTIADKIFQTARTPKWDMDLVQLIGPVLIAGMGCTAMGLAIHYLGNRDKKYALPVSLIVTGLLSLAGLVVYLVSV
jgi:hypothetical protein